MYLVLQALLVVCVYFVERHDCRAEVTIYNHYGLIKRII